MQIVTREMRAAVAAQAWHERYDVYDESFGFSGGGRALDALGENPDPDDVDAVIGNESWTKCFCAGCSSYHGDAAAFGEDDDMVLLCLGCLENAVAMLRGQREPDEQT